MKSGSSKKKVVVHWFRPLVGMLKFIVDGAVRDKPSLVSIGGILDNNTGDVLFMFSKH